LTVARGGEASQTLRREEAARPGWQARLSLGFERRAEATVLVQREHYGPLRVQKALYPEGAAVCHAIVLHPPGGVAGGDRLEISVAAAPGAHALLTTPGASKWYRSGGRKRAAVIDRPRRSRGSASSGCRRRRSSSTGPKRRCIRRIELAAGGVFCGWEVLCLGRTAAGERFSYGHLDLATRIEREGRPLWIERGQLCGGSPWLEAAAGLAGQPVSATLLLAGRAVEREWLEGCRALPVADGLLTGVTALPELLVARCLAPGAEAGTRLVGRRVAAVAPGGTRQASRAAAHLEYLNA
jgi:urease accessory protein